MPLRGHGIMAAMNTLPHRMDAGRMVDVASMQEAGLELRAVARKAGLASNFPPMEFALRYGAIPPVLAGRAKETAVLRSMVHGIQNEKGDQCLLGLHGIRGQGKTALIKILADMARQAGIHVVTLGASGTNADFARSIMDAESLAATTSDAASQEGGVGINALLKAEGRTTRTRQATETRTARLSIDAALEHRLAQGNKVLLILDEAHNLREEAAQALFNAYQARGTKGTALGFAFAGTPDLPDHLSEMGVTFTERPGRHGRMPLGPITDANAVMAVLSPFAERGVLPEGMTSETPGVVVQGVADACCGYPYYTQLLGDALHQAWTADEQPNAISEEHLLQAMNAFEAERLRHYQTRLLELEKIGAVECARKVAAALDAQGFITRKELKRCVSQGLRERRSLEQAGEAIREDEWLDGLWSAKGGMAPALLHRGFLWSPEGGAGDRFQAGIPSLASYMLEAVPPPPSNNA